MKAQSVKYRIWGGNGARNAHWEVREIATGKTVWRGKTFRGARTAHAQRELGIPYRAARRMGNV